MDPNNFQSIAEALMNSLGGTQADMTADFLKKMKTASELTVAAEYEDNAARSLGMETEELAYQNGMLALTDPKLYAQSRLKAFKEVKDAVNKEYKDIFKEMSKTGQSRAIAEQNAIDAANRVRNIKLESFYLMYPESANAISSMKIGQGASANFTGAATSLGAPKRTPVRRSKAKK